MRSFVVPVLPAISVLFKVLALFAVPSLMTSLSIESIIKAFLGSIILGVLQAGNFVAVLVTIWDYHTHPALRSADRVKVFIEVSKQNFRVARIVQLSQFKRFGLNTNFANY